MTEAEMNEKLREESEATVHWIEATLLAYAITQFGTTRLSVNDILADFAKKDGTIAENRVQSLIRKMDEIDTELRKIAVTTIEDVVKRTSERQVKTVAGVLSSFDGEKLPTETIVRETLKFSRAGVFDDDTPLSKRVWNTSGAITDNLRRELRAGIVQGESVNQLMKRVRGVYQAEEWQIRRLVTTEANVAMRKVTADSAQRSNIVVGLKITDHPGHKNHTRHKCYELAHQNKYGLGMGVYPVDNTEVLSPHPQCTSTLTYVLKSEVARSA